MATSRAYTPWTLVILQILSDGEWHPAPEIIAEAARHVPPGVGKRVMERERARQGLTGPRARPIRVDLAVAGGRRLVQEALGSLRRFNSRIHYERRDDGVTYYRMDVR